MRHWLKTLLTRHKAAVSPTPSTIDTATPEALVPAPERVLDEFFRVAEVCEAEFFVGDLFRRRFATDSFPGSPKHFIAFYKNHDGSFLPLGYVHYEMWNQQAMAGGLVIDDRIWRLLPVFERGLIREQGGVAELLMTRSIAQLPSQTKAVWAYIGDKLSAKVNFRVGFRPTEEQYIWVIWQQDLSQDEKQSWIEQIVEYGPF